MAYKLKVPASPKFRLTKADVPSTVKSAWISAAAIFAVAVLTQIPQIGFESELVAIVATGVAGFLVHLLKQFLTER